MVREPPVELLRHPEVVAPEPGLHMPNLDVLLHCGQGSGEHGVGITLDKNAVRPGVCELLLELGYRFSGLLTGRARAHAQERIWLRQLELLEEYLRHLVVVVLARVHEPDLHLRFLEREVHGGHLDYLRPGAHDNGYEHQVSRMSLGGDNRIEMESNRKRQVLRLGRAFRGAPGHTDSGSLGGGH